jgi:hypothetical protein
MEGWPPRLILKAPGPCGTFGALMSEEVAYER